MCDKDRSRTKSDCYSRISTFALFSSFIVTLIPMKTNTLINKRETGHVGIGYKLRNACGNEPGNAVSFGRI